VCKYIAMKEELKQKFLPDEYIFKQGEKGEKAYLLLDGRVAIEINNKKVQCFSFNREIICPIGWIEEENEEVKLIDFRTINIQKK